LKIHPVPQFDMLSAAFSCLGSVHIDSKYPFTIGDSMQAMIALAALPQKWEHLIPIITNKYELSKLEMKHVRETVQAQWETETNRGQHKANHSANKLSAVKRKRGDPRFSQQDNQQQRQGGSSGGSGQQQHSQRGQRGKGKGKGKGKDKGKQRDPNHVHIASV